MSAAEMREALKPCPFCGEEAGRPRKITSDERSGYQETVTISCGKGCGAIVEVNGSLNKSGWSDAAAGATEAAAIAAWNRRALPDEGGMVERVARALHASIEQAIYEKYGPDANVELAKIIMGRLPVPLNYPLMARAALRAINGGEP